MDKIELRNLESIIIFPLGEEVGSKHFIGEV